MRRSLPRDRASAPSSAYVLGAELAVAAATTACVVGLAVWMEDAGLAAPARGFAVLAFAAAIGSTILLAVAAWLSRDGRAARVTTAVACFAVAYLSIRAVGPGGHLARDLAMLAVVGLLASALPRRDSPPRAGRAAAVLGVVGAACAALLVVAPGSVPAAVDLAVEIATGVAAGAVSLGLVLAGARSGRPLLRQAGVAFVLVGAGQLAAIGEGPITAAGPRSVVALELAGALCLLLAAGRFAFATVTSVMRAQEESESRLAAAETTSASLRARDHEMRNVLLGLSGAVRVLRRDDVDPTSPEVRRLREAATDELERLRRLLETGAVASRPAPLRAAVGPLLRDLAALHRADGLDVAVQVAGNLHARISTESLAQVVTNLLVNCARHAPGARVRVRAARVGDRVLVEVADDGPGLPPGDPRRLLRQGVTGPGSDGQGIGLHVSAELVRRSHGTMRIGPTSAAGGCTVVVELPPAVAGAVHLERVTA